MFYGLLLERVVASKFSARTFQSSSPAAAALGFLGKHILLSLQDYYSISLFIHHTRQGVSAGRGVVATTTQKQRQFGWLHPHAHRHTHSTQSLRTNTLAHSLTHTHTYKQVTQLKQFPFRMKVYYCCFCCCTLFI